MINGIRIANNTKIADKQKLWNTGCRFVYADVEDNGCLLNVAGDAEFQGFLFGGLKRLRYFPGAGSGDSQAQNFMVSLSRLPTAKLPPVLEITTQDGPLPELNAWLKQFFKCYSDYTKGGKVVIKASKSIIDGIKPIQEIQDYILANGLWIYSPSNPIELSPLKFYTLRSYGAKSIEGTMAEWVDVPGTLDQFKAWVNGVALRFSTIEVPPVVVPPPVIELTDSQKIDVIYRAVIRIQTL